MYSRNPRPVPQSRPVAAVALMFAGSMLALPFVLTNADALLPTFRAEWLSIALGLLASLATLLNGRHLSAKLTASMWWLIVFSLLLFMQAAIGDIPYYQLPSLGVLYTLYAVMLIWTGAQLAASAGMERTVSILAGFLLSGALANSVAGIIQFYGRPALLEDWIAQMPSGRALGNISLINLYANYLALGQVSLLYLWLQRQVRTPWAILGALLLAYASALSGTRSSLLFLIWIAALGFLSARTAQNPGGEAYAVGKPGEIILLRNASWALAGCSLLVHLVVPWINNILIAGTLSPGSFARLAALSDAYAEPRWQAWSLAMRIFVDLPILGVGMGQFPGAAFKAGLHPDLSGYVWTSPHNLVLHLLAETGIAGTIPVLGALYAWWSQSARRYFTAPTPAMWWSIAIVGIVMLHSLLEFPLWNAQFLGITALAMGVGSQLFIHSSAGKSSRLIISALCLILFVALCYTIKDYFRLDLARVSGTKLTLASEQERIAATQSMRALSHGLLGPVAEGWILLGTEFDLDDLDGKLALSSRVIHFWPSNKMLVRHAVYLALYGRAEEAREILLKTMSTFPSNCDENALILERALATNEAAIAPLLHVAQKKTGCVS